MSAPTNPIDSSLTTLSGDIFYVLESSSIWKTTDLSSSGSGTATWAEVYTLEDFKTVNNLTDGGFLRILAPTLSLIYVLAWGTGEDASAYPWMLRSDTGGINWSAHKIDDTALGLRDYTVKSASKQHTEVLDFTLEDVTIPVPRLADAENTYSPWGIAWSYTASHGGAWPDDSGWQGEAGEIIGGASPNYSATTRGINPLGYPDPIQPIGIVNALLSPANEAITWGWMDDYLATSVTKVINESSDMPKEDARINVVIGLNGQGFGYPTTSECTWNIIAYVFYNVPSPIMPNAFDVSATNNNWLYVGLVGKIRGSEDGGLTWFDFYTDHGANDICVDPQIAGAIYYWATDGNLNLLLKNTLGFEGTLTQEAIMTETPLEVPLRISRDVNSGKLWAIPNGTTIVRRENAINVDQKTGLVNARGLHSYNGGFLIAVENDIIYLSDDYGVTWVDKTGSWATYGAGLNAHRMTGT